MSEEGQTDLVVSAQRRAAFEKIDPKLLWELKWHTRHLSRHHYIPVVRGFTQDEAMYIYRMALAIKSVEAPADAPTQPIIGRKILSYLCTPDNLESVIGDFEEIFRMIAIEDGMRAAQLWYWWQIARSSTAFAMKLLGGLVAIKELLKRL